MSDRDERELELVPGLVSEPLFKTREEYERFRQEFYDAVRPKLEEIYGFHHRWDERE